MFYSGKESRYEKVDQQDVSRLNNSEIQDAVAEATEVTENFTGAEKEPPEPLASKIDRWCVICIFMVSILYFIFISNASDLTEPSTGISPSAAPSLENALHATNSYPSTMPTWSAKHTANHIMSILKNSSILSSAVQTPEPEYTTSSPTSSRKLIAVIRSQSSSKSADRGHSKKTSLKPTAAKLENSTMVTKSGHVLTFAPWFNEWQVKVWDSKPDKPLQFIHITKTGGTSIEDIANMADSGIKWGRHNYGRYGWWHRLYNPADEEMADYERHRGHSERWHLTSPSRFNVFKKNHHFFTIVRNPYDRLISEFHCRWGGMGKYPTRMRNMTGREKNAYIREKIHRRSMVRGGHYSDMFRYIDMNLTVHVLRFENLAEELRELWGKYNLTAELEVLNNSFLHHQTAKSKVFRRSNFGPRTRRLVKKVYQNDFDWFGYDINDLSDRRELGETSCLFEC